MKKWSIILAAAIALFLSSAGSDGHTEAAAGNHAPYFELKNDIRRVNLSAARGKYVVINFWSAQDAQSRIDNALFDRAFTTGSRSDVEYVSVCLDDDEILWKQIMIADGLHAVNQYMASESPLTDILSDYGTESGCRNFLISPQGEVLAAGLDVPSILSRLAS
ncbi:MAG: redoxin domain-containing protein [Muribaculaceae bacterium]|nr:redoxin domain-containing protein [Muribaculaceae bacterium]